ARSHSQEDFGCEHERTDVQTLLAAAWHPLLVDGDQVSQRAQEPFFGQLGKTQPTRRVSQARGIPPRTERPNRLVGMHISLESLKNLLRIMQNSDCRIQHEWRIQYDPRIVTTLLAYPMCNEHVIGERGAEAGIGQNLFALSLSAR